MTGDLDEGDGFDHATTPRRLDEHITMRCAPCGASVSSGFFVSLAEAGDDGLASPATYHASDEHCHRGELPDVATQPGRLSRLLDLVRVAPHLLAETGVSVHEVRASGP